MLGDFGTKEVRKIKDRVVDDRMRHFHWLDEQHLKSQREFLTYLESQGIEIVDDPPSKAWRLYCKAIQDSAAFELFWAGRGDEPLSRYEMEEAMWMAYLIEA